MRLSLVFSSIVFVIGLAFIAAGCDGGDQARLSDAALMSAFGRTSCLTIADRLNQVEQNIEHLSGRPEGLIQTLNELVPAVFSEIPSNTTSVLGNLMGLHRRINRLIVKAVLVGHLLQSQSRGLIDLLGWLLSAPPAVSTYYLPAIALVATEINSSWVRGYLPGTAPPWITQLGEGLSNFATLGLDERMEGILHLSDLVTTDTSRRLVNNLQRASLALWAADQSLDAMVDLGICAVSEENIEDRSFCADLLGFGEVLE